MSARVQSSPFRETAFDQKLDRMLDDLKSTVSGDEGDLRTPGLVSPPRPPSPKFVEMFRSSSRASSRAGSVGRRYDDSRRLDLIVDPSRHTDVPDGGRQLETHDSKVVDGGRMHHHHKEYNSPDNRMRTVADTYQYDSGSDNPNSNYHKKVMKSTYSSFKTEGGLSKDLEELKRGPSELEMERALSKESRDILNSISSTNRHNKVVDASEDVARSLAGALACIGSETENEEADPTSQPPVQHMVKEVHMVEQPQDVIQSDSANLLDPSSHSLIQTNEVSKVQSSKISTVQTVTNSSQQQSVQYEVNAEDPNSTLKRLNRDIKELGSIIDHMDPGTVDEKSASSLAVTTVCSDVVSRYGRTEALHVTEDDRQGIPVGAIEDSRRAGPTDAVGTVAHSKDEKLISNGHYDDDLHDLLPGEGKGGEDVRRIVWRNRYEKTYETTDATGSPMMSIERDARHRSPPPPESSSLSTLTHHHVAPPIAPSPPSVGYNSSTAVNDVSKTTNVIHHHHTTTNKETHHHTNTSNLLDSRHNTVVDTYNNKNLNKYPGDPPHPGTNVVGYSIDSYSQEKREYPAFPTAPKDVSPPYNPDSRSPTRPGEPQININIHKTETYSSTTRTDDRGFPITSTPHRGTSRSPDRHYGRSDSLDRDRGLPFPNESPVKPQDPATIPRRVDELLSDFSERNGAAHGYSGHPEGQPLITHESQQKSSPERALQLSPERNEINTMSPSRLREEREKSKNQAGPAVYYPPGQEAFTESMHTMTLKEGGRRGKAKWRAEAKSGYKESSKHSESEGGVKMVPLCAPLCCGAACTIM